MNFLSIFIFCAMVDFSVADNDMDQYVKQAEKTNEYINLADGRSLLPEIIKNIVLQTSKMEEMVYMIALPTNENNNIIQELIKYQENMESEIKTAIAIKCNALSRNKSLDSDKINQAEGSDALTRSKTIKWNALSRNKSLDSDKINQAEGSNALSSNRGLNSTTKNEWLHKAEELNAIIREKIDGERINILGDLDSTRKHTTKELDPFTRKKIDDKRTYYNHGGLDSDQTSQAEGSDELTRSKSCNSDKRNEASYCYDQNYLRILGKERRYLTGAAVKALIRAVIDGDSKISTAFASYYQFCRLLGVDRSITNQLYDSPLIKTTFVSFSKCYLGTTGNNKAYIYENIDGVIYEIFQDGKPPRSLSSLIDGRPPSKK